MSPRQRASTLTWDDVSQRAIEHGCTVEVDAVNWFSTYRVHHRVAEHFRKGRAFLLGDAAHVHSPVGGQGMNTGIGDAINLAWKLAAVLQAARAGVAPRQLRAGAHRLRPPPGAHHRPRLQLGDEPELERAASCGSKYFRGSLPVLAHARAMRRFMFRTVSQTAVNYRGSALSEGRAGAVRGGDRLPWVPLGDATPITSRRWPRSTGRCMCMASREPRSSRSVATAACRCTSFPGAPTGARAGSSATQSTSCAQTAI